MYCVILVLVAVFETKFVLGDGACEEKKYLVLFRVKVLMSVLAFCASKYENELGRTSAAAPDTDDVTNVDVFHCLRVDAVDEQQQYESSNRSSGIVPRL